MLQTLFTIPYEIGGIALMGNGLLLWVWGVASLGLLVWLVRRSGWSHDTLSYLPLLALTGAAIWGLPRIFPGGLPIRGYGVMLLLAVLAGVGLAARRARQMGVDTELIYSLALWLFVAGISGARLFHVIEYWATDYRHVAPDGRLDLAATLGAILNVPQGGLVVYGSLIGGALAFAAFVIRHRLPALALADLVAPSLLLGLALGRIGCLLNGCCYGGSCELPWAVSFPYGSPPYREQEIEYEIDPLAGVPLLGRPNEPPRLGPVPPDSPAGRAGLPSGVAVVSIDDRPVATAGEARFALDEALRSRGAAKIVTAGGETFSIAPRRSLPVHPTQLYSAINALLLCGLLLAWYPFRRRDGEVVALLLTLYPMARFLLEIIRTDETAVFRTGMSISQNVSLLLLVAAVGLWIYIARQPRGSALPAAA